MPIWKIKTVHWDATVGNEIIFLQKVKSPCSCNNGKEDSNLVTVLQVWGKKKSQQPNELCVLLFGIPHIKRTQTKRPDLFTGSSELWQQSILTANSCAIQDLLYNDTFVNNFFLFSQSNVSSKLLAVGIKIKYCFPDGCYPHSYNQSCAELSREDADKGAKKITGRREEQTVIAFLVA